ncbi:MAG TPA: MFS transporter, partial [Actinomycetota bacterium]|nr:MFS transporter [Actinomycetota bacterium]
MTRRREDSARRASTYKLLLGLPGVGLQALCGMLAQLTQGAAAVGMILVVHESTGSLAIAGGVTAGFSAGVCVARPAQGRLIDRRGAPPVLTACAVLHVGALIGLVAAAGSAAPAWALIQLGCLAGLGLPPVSTSMRVAWGRRMPGEGRTAAFSLVYLTQTMAILVGPLLLGALVALASASLALAAVAGVAGGGTLVFAR